MRHIWSDKLLGHNHFWHVPQTCPDVRNPTARPARFLRVDLLLGSCATQTLTTFSLFTIIVCPEGGLTSSALSLPLMRELGFGLDMQLWGESKIRDMRKRWTRPPMGRHQSHLHRTHLSKQKLGLSAMWTDVAVSH